MEVKIKERSFKVYWMYNSMAISFIAHQMGSSEEKIRQLSVMPMKKQIEEFGKLHPEAGPLPADVVPDTTWCFIIEGDKQIATSSVCRYYKDIDDRDKARKYSLAKALHESGFSREERKIFWVSYLNRGIRIPAPMVIV